MSLLVWYLMGAGFTAAIVGFRREVRQDMTIEMLVRMALLWPLTWLTWVVRQCGLVIDEVINS